jgi:hypothetical protein
MRAAAGQQQAILDSEIRTREKITDLQIESSGLGIEARQMQAYAQSSGTEMGKAPRVALDRLDSAHTYLSDLRQRFPTMPMIEATTGANGEVRFFELTEDGHRPISRGYLDIIVGEQAQNKIVADNIDSVMQTGDFPAERQQELIKVKNDLQMGRITRQAAESRLASLSDRDQRLESSDEQRTRVQQTNDLTRAVLNQIMPNPQNGLLSDTGNRLVRRTDAANQIMPSVSAFENNATLIALASSNAPLTNVSRGMADYIQKNVVSVNSLLENAQARGFNTLDRQGNPANIHQYQLWQNLDQLVRNAGSGAAGSSLYINPFARTNDPRAVVDANELSTILYDRLKGVTPTTEAVTEEELNQTRLAQTQAILGF